MTDNPLFYTELALFDDLDPTPAAKRFPLLSRIDDYYTEAGFEYAERDQLLNECMFAMTLVRKHRSLSFLLGLVLACTEASKRESGILLLGD